jgi:glycerol-3-phosphate dehydrogenase (NAD(P)+)
MATTPGEGAVLVAGAGSWGTALALHLASAGQKVLLWGHRPEEMERLARERVNTRYLPDHPFPPSLLPIGDLHEALGHTQDLLLAVPCRGIRPLLQAARTHPAAPRLRVCWAAKGIEEGTDLLLHEVVTEVLGPCPQAALSGPSFASEVARGLPTAVTLASLDPAFTAALLRRFHHGAFRVYASDDLIGVEMGGALKNCLAIAAGVADGLHLGANCRAALITRGLVEITRLGIALGGRLPTFMGLSGLGDLVLTCTDDQSRNRRFGKLLGQGLPPAAAEAEIRQVVEGARTAHAAARLAARHGVEIPIIAQIARLLRDETTPRAALQALLARDPTVEFSFLAR